MATTKLDLPICSAELNVSAGTHSLGLPGVGCDEILLYIVQHGHNTGHYLIILISKYLHVKIHMYSITKINTLTYMYIIFLNHLWAHLQ